MALVLHFHPLASFCHKVLIALYENATVFEGRILDFADPAASARLEALWPVGKIPVLEDSGRGRVVAETSIIIDYLDRHYPGASPLLPADPDKALEARLWDRFFDLYVSVPMQKIVLDRLRAEGQGDPIGVAEAYATLKTAYAMAENQLRTQDWAAGDTFGIADCSAFPALFYARTLEPFAPGQPALSAYFERLLVRPSVARAIEEARPYFGNYPYREKLESRFLGA